MKALVRFCLITVSLTTAPAFADGFAKLAAVYLASSSGTGASKSESSRTMFEINAAYVMPKGWAFGALYASESEKNGSTSASRTSMGPTIGWITRKENGAYIMAHYLFQSEYEQYKGDGYQADLGYKFSVRKMAIGLQFSYKSYTYKELSGSKLATPLQQTKIDPYFAILLEF